MMNNPTYREALNWASSYIQSNIDPTAPEFLLEAEHDWTPTQLVLHRNDEMIDFEFEIFKSQIERLMQNEPAQYIAGKAPFFGRTFTVNDQVLIPENETEELVEWVLTEFDERPLKVLDLGTGSGVIGITLKLERPNWNVTASDISAAALEVATLNANDLNAEVEFIQSDIFTNLAEQKFDLVVSNPPYIGEEERDEMDTAVLEYVPDLALFADNHGLAIYEKIFSNLNQIMMPQGVLFAETGYGQEKMIKELANCVLPRAVVETKHDINDKMRMVKISDLNESDK